MKSIVPQYPIQVWLSLLVTQLSQQLHFDNKIVAQILLIQNRISYLMCQ
jgi:hypothetical protein